MATNNTRPSPKGAPTVEEIKEAMLTAWTQFVADTGRFPDDFKAGGRISYLTFKPGTWADHVATAIFTRFQSAEADGGWLPIVLCPTDGVLRSLRLPDGSEIAGYFDGPHNRLGATQRWRKREVAYHNPARIIGQRGGVDQWSKAYNTYIDSDLPEGVYPTHFRPNDTVFGSPSFTAKIDPDGDDSGPITVPIVKGEKP